MLGEVDARLIGLLQGSMSLADSLRDVGTTGEILVRLGREDGLTLLKRVAGASDAEAEAWSQRGRPPRDGVNSLRISSLTFEWPQSNAQGVAHLFSVAPSGMGAPANGNLRPRFFDEDAPVRR